MLFIYIIGFIKLGMSVVAGILSAIILRRTSERFRILMIFVTSVVMLVFSTIGVVIILLISRVVKSDIKKSTIKKSTIKYILAVSIVIDISFLWLSNYILDEGIELKNVFSISEKNEEILAYVNGNKINDYHFNTYIRERYDGHTSDNLDFYINQIILELEAAEKGITVSQNEIDNLYATLIEGAGSEELLLEMNEKGKENLLNSFEKGLLMQKIIENTLTIPDELTEFEKQNVLLNKLRDKYKIEKLTIDSKGNIIDYIAFMGEEVIATVDIHEITQGDFTSFLMNRYNTTALEIVDLLIEQKMIELEAVEKDIAVSPSEINKVIRSYKENLGSEGLLLWIQQSGMTVESYTNLLDKELLTRKVIEHTISIPDGLTNEEKETFFDENYESFISQLKTKYKIDKKTVLIGN